MTRSRSLVVLAVVTVLVAAGAVLTHEDSGAVPKSGELVFPGLLANVNDATRIEAIAGEDSFELAFRDGRWIAPGKFDHPAAEDKVRQLLVGASALERIEPKTANPDLYAKIGVEEPGVEGSESVRWRVTDAAGTELVSLLVGRSAPSKSDPERYDYYVRARDDAQAWLVEGRLPRERGIAEWLANGLATIDRPRIAGVGITHPDGERVEVTREDPFGDDYVLHDVPEGAAVDAQWSVNDIGRFVESLELEDVRPAAEGPLGSDDRRIVEATTFDGLRVRVTLAKEGDATWATLDAEFDASLVREFDAGDDETRAAAVGKLRTREDVEREAAELGARWGGWVYRIPEFKADYAAKRMDDLVKTAGEQEQEKAGAG